MSVPRLAAIEYPLGYLLGLPGDEVGQSAVLRATLALLAEMSVPGTAVDLPFEWSASTPRLNLKPPQTPPIVRYLMRHPWHISNFFARDIPDSRRLPAC